TGTVRVAGWAVAASGAPVDRIWIEVDADARGGGTYLGAATLGVSRPDVAAALGDPALEPSGFEFRVDASASRGGWHWLVAFAHEAGQPDDAGWDVAAVDVFVAP